MLKKAAIFYVKVQIGSTVVERNVVIPRGTRKQDLDRAIDLAKKDILETSESRLSGLPVVVLQAELVDMSAVVDLNDDH